MERSLRLFILVAFVGILIFPACSRQEENESKRQNGSAPQNRSDFISSSASGNSSLADAQEKIPGPEDELQKKLELLPESSAIKRAQKRLKAIEEEKMDKEKRAEEFAQRRDRASALAVQFNIQTRASELCDRKFINTSEFREEIENITDYSDAVDWERIETCIKKSSLITSLYPKYSQCQKMIKEDGYYDCVYDWFLIERLDKNEKMKEAFLLVSYAGFPPRLTYKSEVTVEGEIKININSTDQAIIDFLLKDFLSKDAGIKKE